MTDRRTPVYLLTGYLGSGKTTLLSSWLQQPEFAGAALIVNEIGEVGLDDRLLGASAASFATESSALIANACVCCTGLPGLGDALAELFWNRLHRKIPRFGSVVIETTGLADPRPVVELLGAVPLLQERYRLAGIVATTSAVAGVDVLAHHQEARAQVEAADVVIVTKTDQADAGAVDEVRAAVEHLTDHATIELSARASLSASALMAAIERARRVVEQPRSDGRDRHDRPDVDVHHHTADHEHRNDHDHDHGHAHHDATSSFVPVDEASTPQALLERIDAIKAARGDRLLRIKGVIAMADGSWSTAQWSLGDQRAELTPFIDHGSAAPPRSGLTIIEAA